MYEILGDIIYAEEEDLLTRVGTEKDAKHGKLSISQVFKWSLYRYSILKKREEKWGRKRGIDGEREREKRKRRGKFIKEPMTIPRSN